MSRASAVRRSDVRDAAPLFAALGDETRLRLVMRLAEGGPGSITRLSAKSKVSRQAISKHLAVLSDANEYLNRISRTWDQAIDRLRAFVEAESE